MPDINIVHWDTSNDGLINENNLIRKLQSMGYQCNTYSYPVGTCFPDHIHQVDKIDAVLKGRLKITVKGNSMILGAGDYICIPRGVLHNAEVIGKESVISIDAIKLDDEQ